MLTFKAYLEEKAMQPADLKVTDLRKDDNRVAMFIKKVADGEKFSTKDNGFDVVIDADQLAAVKKFMKD